MEGWRRASSSLDFAYRNFKSVLQLIVCDSPFVEALTEEEKEKLAKIKKKMKRKVHL